MKTFFFIFFILLVLSLDGLAQFPHCLMPGPVIGSVSYGDSLLNTREILQKAGIKKIYAYHSSSEKLNTYRSQTSVINKNGNIESITTCFPKNEHTNTEWCIFDTVLYDDLGRIHEAKSRDTRGYENSQILYEHIGENEVKFSQITKMQNKQWDTLIDYRYFNKKGQMVKLIQTRKNRPIETSLYYYNADGLPDSVQYENSQLPSIVFKRINKGKKKIIDAQIQHSRFKWVFDQSGQCNSLSITTIYLPRSNYTGVIKGETVYRYNADGTLSKIYIKRSDKVKSTLSYTYSK